MSVRNADVSEFLLEVGIDLVDHSIDDPDILLVVPLILLVFESLVLIRISYDHFSDRLGLPIFLASNFAFRIIVS